MMSSPPDEQRQTGALPFVPNTLDKVYFDATISSSSENVSVFNPPGKERDMALWSGADHGGVKPTDVGTSAKKNTEVGSGSRPTPSRYKIETSSPEDARTNGKDPPAGWLK